ncbi:MAG: S41 family peptidase [Bacteroidales bacterium]|nr:S41 family peptidase [Lachnoclostridium sp.]MCM1383176.1 S41 family peptidase [Lachnoclostridium sp.]MCM1464598.1 S41 family peptidase [Bacteroidales bacterium]
MEDKEQIQQNRDSGKGLFAGGIIVGMSLMLMLVMVTYLGTKVARIVQMQNGKLAPVSFAENSIVDAEMVQKLQELESTVNRYFYLEKVTDEEMRDGIYKGMLKALNDPYTEYYTAEELNSLLNQTEGIYYGIGAYVQLDKITSLPQISGVIEGTPAQEAGLRANDLIYEVDGESTYGLTLTEAVALIKGEEGTQVVLTIAREDEKDYLTIPVTRRKVESPTVKYEMLEDNMAYIQITEFDDVTIDQFADALATMKGSGMEGLILDVRGNPGGSLTSVVEICRMLLPEGRIVYTEDKNGKQVEYSCDGKRELQVPLVVLVDMNSASASEILAGAIQDYGIGTLVGTTTFGKGIVQQLIPLLDGSAVKITVSSYFTPKGRNIHGVGIVPDVECKFDGEAYYDTDNPVDNQLEKAKQVLGDLMK